MLNGVAPIIIFSFKPQLTQALFSGVAGIPVIGDVLNNIGIPIPIYLDENLTGIHVESESKAIDIDTQIQTRYDGKPANYDQRGLSNLITINMLANRTSILLSVLLAMNDVIFSKVVAKEYNITYLNGATTIFGGLLHGFSTQSGSDDDLIRIVMQIEKGNQNKPTPANLSFQLPKITGATPVVGAP